MNHALEQARLQAAAHVSSTPKATTSSSLRDPSMSQLSHSNTHSPTLIPSSTSLTSPPPPLPVAGMSKVERCGYELLLTSIPASMISQATGAIMNLMFFPNSSDGTPAPQPRFFSYTHTHDELSLLMDMPTSQTAFPEGMLNIGPGSWRILEIQEGSEIIDVPGIVSSLCAPLFEQQRVEEMLYLSTFVSDLILVREKHVDVAETILSNNLHFLVESRRKVIEAMAAAEEQERQAELQRKQMEDEDMRRANESNANEDEAIESEAAVFQLNGIPIPVPSRDDHHATESLASSASTNTDIFQFSMASSVAPSAAPIKATTSTVKVIAQKIPLDRESTPSPPRFQQAQPLSPNHLSTNSTISNNFQQLSMESEGGGPEDEDGIAMHLSKLPFRLVLLTFHIKYLPQCTYAILHALMHSPSATTTPSHSSASMPPHFRPSFFSFTQAGSQISLIVESSCLPLFPHHIVTRHKSVWNALQVSQGTESTDPAGLVAPLSSVLAKVGVSIYYLSTYNLDYILVAEKEVELALTTLTQSMNVMVEA